MTKKSVILLILSFNMILNISFSQVPYSYETIDLKIDILSKTSKLIESEKIGSSVKGKNIKVLKVGKGKTHYLITGGMHARENINPSILLWTADYLVKERKELLKDVTIHIIPLLNPDGYKLAMNPKDHFIFGNDWKASELKANFNGVDLNKNFPTVYWDHEKDKLMDTKKQIRYFISNQDEPALKSFEGEKIQPETKALMDYMWKYDFKTYIDMHSRGEVIYWDTWQKPLEYRKYKSRLISYISKKLGYKKMDWVSYNQAKGYGYATDYFSLVKGGDAFTVETANININLPNSDYKNFEKAFNETKDLIYHLHKYYKDNELLKVD